MEEVLSPLADKSKYGGSMIDFNVRAERMGWLPSAPQLKTNPIQVVKDATAAGVEPKDYVVNGLKDGSLKMSCEDPDHPNNWPRNLFVWRSNLLGSSGSLFVAAAHVEDARVVSSPYPALQQTMEIAPGGTFTIRLRCCAGMDASTLEAKLFQPHPDNWDAQIARLALRHQADLLRVSTPNPEWDAVFLSAQNQAFQLLSLIHISEPTRLLSISYAVVCLKKKKKKQTTTLRSHSYKIISNKQ